MKENENRPEVRVRNMTYNLQTQLEGCCFRYLELVGIDKEDTRCLGIKAPTPFLPDETGGESIKAVLEVVPAVEKPSGELQDVAQQVLMKMLYSARMARYDLLRACQH